MWDMNSMKDVQLNDERKGEYSFHWTYNYISNSKVKVATGYTAFWKYVNYLYMVFVATTIVLIMLWFEDLTYDDVNAIDAATL